jgi:hypothetical protein
MTNKKITLSSILGGMGLCLIFWGLGFRPAPLVIANYFIAKGVREITKNNPNLLEEQKKDVNDSPYYQDGPTGKYNEVTKTYILSNRGCPPPIKTASPSQEKSAIGDPSIEEMRFRQLREYVQQVVNRR